MDLHYYLQNLYEHIQSQEERIRQLEKKISEMEEELKDVKEKQPLHVGTIEYKFDQLKIETLEGTLNIGLNPSELGEIDDFSISHKMETNNNLNVNTDHIKEIETAMDQYLNGEFQQVMKRISEEQQRKIDEPFIQFIQEDIKKQLPERINYYVKQIVSGDQREITREAIEKIVTQMKQDIENAVFQFLQHFPTEKKE